jgi:hypothetical protein
LLPGLVDNGHKSYSPSHRWRRRLLLDQHPVQLPEIAVIEKRADHILRDPDCQRVWVPVSVQCGAGKYRNRPWGRGCRTGTTSLFQGCSDELRLFRVPPQTNCRDAFSRRGIRGESCGYLIRVPSCSSFGDNGNKSDLPTIAWSNTLAQSFSLTCSVLLCACFNCDDGGQETAGG